ncbi:hypothetical protein D1BOALGB6SA_7829 [Olavius sp. associated proteobacterium Delta 1]|nr:hypothetical protein D1BOALGB6SA_7829 [Olavius sp. associated proteobacterium Delta 1]
MSGINTPRTIIQPLLVATLLVMSALGCSQRTLLPAGAEPDTALSQNATYGVAWRSTTRSDPDVIMAAAINFDGPIRSDGTRSVTSTSPRSISLAAGSHPRLVRVSMTEFFAAWREGDSVYGRYLNAADMTSVFPSDPPLELNAGESRALVGFDISYSEFENRVLLVTGRSGGNIYLYGITRTRGGSPPFRSIRLQTLPSASARTGARVPRIAVGRPGGTVTILVTAIPFGGGTIGDYHLIRVGEATSRYDLDPAPGMAPIEDHRCVYDPVRQRFLEVMGGWNQIYSAVIYPDGSHGRNVRLSLPAFSPTAPATIDDGGETFKRFSVADARVTFEDVSPTGRSSGSVFTLAYSEYYKVIATTYRRGGGSPPPPPVFAGSTTTHYETGYTHGLDVLGQVRGSRVVRGPTGLRSDARKVKAALSSEPEPWHAIIIGSDVAQHAERYQEP